jgi:hypothetical protein
MSALRGRNLSAAVDGNAFAAVVAWPRSSA